MRSLRLFVVGLVCSALAACEAAGPTTQPTASGVGQAMPSALPTQLPPSPLPTPAAVSGGTSLYFLSTMVDMGTIPVGGSAEAVLKLVNLGSGPVEGVEVVLDDRLATARGLRIASIGAPCDRGTIVVGSLCEVVVRASPREPVVGGSMLVKATGELNGQGIQTYATVAFRGSMWTTVARDEEEEDAPEDPGWSRDVGTADGISTEHRISGAEEALDGWDATEYVNRVAGTERWRNATMLPGMFAVIAVVSDRVFVAMESYRCGGAGIGVMRNLENGAPGGWSSTTCLSRASDMMSGWAPSIAAAGPMVYVVAQATETNRIELWRSADEGGTWKRTRLGVDGGSEYGGQPMIAADGATVLVVWTMDDRAVARRSDDGGRTWSPRELVAPGPVQTLVSDDGRVVLSGTAVAAGGTADDGPFETWTRVWTAAGGWRPVALPLVDDTPCARAIVTPGPGDVLALSCVPPGSYGGVSSVCYWTWSTDLGVTWAPYEALPGLSGTSPTRWTPDGRPQLNLWSEYPAEGGPVTATRIAAPGDP